MARKTGAIGANTLPAKKGKVRWFCVRKGIGFIEVTGTRRHVHFRRSDVQEEADLKAGQRVLFEVGAHVHGPKALKIKLVPAKDAPARDLTKISISLSHHEWSTLTKALHKEFGANGPQLGRLAWMGVATIEAALVNYEHERENGNGNGDSGGGADTGPAREGEVVQ